MFSFLIESLKIEEIPRNLHIKKLKKKCKIQRRNALKSGFERSGHEGPRGGSRWQWHRYEHSRKLKLILLFFEVDPSFYVFIFLLDLIRSMRIVCQSK